VNAGLAHSVDTPSPSLSRAAPPASRIGLTDLFKIGIGPSSSHTMGPMRAARLFVTHLGAECEALTSRILATAYGSLAWTGRGHGTDRALVLGLAGEQVHVIDPDTLEQRVEAVITRGELGLPYGSVIAFIPSRDVVFDTVRTYQRHPNAMSFEAFDRAGQLLKREVWFSVGGGFVEREGEVPPQDATSTPSAPYPYDNAETLLYLGRSAQISIAAMVLANESARTSETQTLAAIEAIATAMFACIERGLRRDGPLPGALRIKRRAKGLFEKADEARRHGSAGLPAMPYVSAFAIAVNEENACGARVVTAPTNGAAGIVPAVLRYYRDFCEGANPGGIRDYFLTATAIGGIIKRNASISGAEMGCQGEVGSAAAMAAAGLAAALGGTNEQIENAAEIALEHHLGMTCDPVGGLVQIPCIERNAFGAIKAINAAALALLGDGKHRVSLDQVIETMRQTGTDMQSKYRETSRGGLALNVPEC
jgi:L-serine dehydratase